MIVVTQVALPNITLTVQHKNNTKKLT